MGKFYRFSIGLFITVALTFASLFLSADPVEAHAIHTSLSIPAINVDAPIGTAYLRRFANGAVTWDMSPFRWQAAHLQGTSWFGQPGNVIIGGHSEVARGEADIFYHLNKVSIGNEIYVSDGDRELAYKIVDVINVSYRDISVLNARHSEQLTLITCDTNSYDANSDFYLRRIIVIATPLSG